MDWNLARQNQIKTVPLYHPVNVSALDGRLLFKVTHCTEPIQETIKNNHTDHAISSEWSEN